MPVVAPGARPARAEQQRVHDRTRHQLDHPRCCRRLLVPPAGAAPPPGRPRVAGGRVVAIGRLRRRHGERVQVLGRVVVAVGQLRGRLLRVLGRTELRMEERRRGAARAGVVLG